MWIVRLALRRPYTFTVVAMLIVILGVVTLAFLLSYVVPGDPARLVAGPNASPQAVASIRNQLGLDRSEWSQYVSYLGRLVHGNLGTSAQTRNPVAQDLATAFPATAELSCVVLVASVLLGVGLGLYAALRHRGLADQAIRLVSVTGISMPTFWLALLLTSTPRSAAA